MEFYLEILQFFVSPGENALGIYTGSKCMLASKMFHRSPFPFIIDFASFVYIVFQLSTFF